MNNAFPFLRVDNRLLHGQVVQFWIPYLRVSNLIIADDLASSNESMVAVYRMALPKSIKLTVVPISALGSLEINTISKKTLVVMSDIFDLARAAMGGFEFNSVTLGNIHSAKGRNRITDAVHLTTAEIEALERFNRAGKRVEIQTFPGDCFLMKITKEGVKWQKSS
jgi:PTS system mannose-specific IIB component